VLGSILAGAQQLTDGGLISEFQASLRRNSTSVMTGKELPRVGRP